MIDGKKIHTVGTVYDMGGIVHGNETDGEPHDTGWDLGEAEMGIRNHNPNAKDPQQSWGRNEAQTKMTASNYLLNHN
jgi:hypothetical protein